MVHYLICLQQSLENICKKKIIKETLLNLKKRIRNQKLKLWMGSMSKFMNKSPKITKVYSNIIGVVI